LSLGIHLLVEKPLAGSLEQADQLVEAARAAGLVLQVGHVERFNPALEAALPHLVRPKYIEAVRASGYTFRSTDVGVVLDLMIHDLDIALALAGSELVDVQALGISIMGRHEDMAQTRLTFANGCVANLSASRTSYEPCRRMQVYCPRAFAAIDFANRTAKLVVPHEQLLERRLDIEHLQAEAREHYRQHLFRDLLPLSDLAAGESNPLLEEQRDFVAAIRHGAEPRVSGVAGRTALAAAERILQCIARHNWEGTAAAPHLVGPLARPHHEVVPEEQPASHPYRQAG
jgi:predicted dehydrogenase